MTSRSRRWAKLHSTAKRSQKFEKPLQLAFSISEATARNFCYHESWAMQVHPLSPKKTKSVPPLQHSKMSSQSNKSSLRQFLPERILTSSKAAHLTSTFSVVISRRSQGWMRTDRWAIEAQTGITYIAVALLVTFHKLLFQPQAFSLSLYEKFCLHSLTKFVIYRFSQG